MPSQPNSFPEVPTTQPPPEENVSNEEHQSFQVPNETPQAPTNEDTQPPVGQPPRRQLPPHLRERWVFDQNYHPTKTTPNQGDVAPIVDWNMHPFGNQPYHHNGNQYPYQTNPYYYSTKPNHSDPKLIYPGFYEQPTLLFSREQNVKATASTFMQACLEVLNFNLSAASIGKGGITRTQI